ncbi:hypothetical protein [Chryseobacterium sp.]|uniref:hypothetical protein n=1 Tax=Chryseobacterium sp. TaxID=1871047 RepID=UPI0025C11B1F|nr:hypothetical protein [Chryseobacterium sp.]MBV8325499.1 hypothetical protein [Chryseobacterium sp.]
MEFISLLIGAGMIYFMLNFKSNRITRKGSMYQNVNKIAIWAFDFLFIIAGILMICKDIIAVFNHK